MPQEGMEMSTEPGSLARTHTHTHTTRHRSRWCEDPFQLVFWEVDAARVWEVSWGGGVSSGRKRSRLWSY